VRPDWLLTCNRPEPTVWRRCDNTAGHPQETKRCSVLRLKSQPRRTACDGKPLKHRTASDESELAKQFRYRDPVISTTDLVIAISQSGATVAHDPLPTIVADRPQMTQLFQNLIANGIKFQKNSAPRVHVSVAEQGSEWVFSVRDNGIGIDSRHSGRIFRIFERLNPSDQYPGTGLGLAISQKIVERHGGRIWVESGAGQGAVFKFTIPTEGSP
jgi:light-regulated signal transduction histidine kinase (bacteriophytochrome)